MPAVGSHPEALRFGAAFGGGGFAGDALDGPYDLGIAFAFALGTFADDDEAAPGSSRPCCGCALALYFESSAACRAPILSPIVLKTSLTISSPKFGVIFFFMEPCPRLASSSANLIAYAILLMKH